jgi:hypothetical protein
MRYSFLLAAVLTPLTSTGLSGCLPDRELEPADTFTANSVWQGTMEQSNPKSSYPVILFVKRRQGEAFEGTIWYPTLGNGLLKVTGRVDAKGAVTFTEDRVIYGEVHGNNLIVVAGSKYSGKLEKSALKGHGSWTHPQTNETVTLTFSMRRAE